jgi:hypothetical protein
MPHAVYVSCDNNNTELVLEEMVSNYGDPVMHCNVK